MAAFNKAHNKVQNSGRSFYVSSIDVQYFMQIIQPVAFNKEADELQYILSTQSIKTLQLNVNEHKKNTSINKKAAQQWVRQQTIPTERPPLVGEVSANFSGQRVSRGQQN
jgi:predicted RND superfamily exporter protein